MVSQKKSDGDHLERDGFCQARIVIKMYMRYVVRLWCLIESIHLYSCVCIALYATFSVKKYIIAAYGYPAFLSCIIFEDTLAK